MIRFGPDQAARPQDIHALGDTQCEFEHRHRFSKHSTDLGQVTVDPFRTILKQDARTVKQKPYRHSPVLSRTEIDKLLLAGILHRSYSNWASPWASPLSVVGKSDGRIQLTCNYKNINEQSIISVLPLPVVDNLL